MGNESFIGKGTVYLEEIGGSTGLLSVGNCSELNLAMNEDKKEQKDFEDAGGAVVNTVSRIDSVTGAITALDISSANLKLALRALVTLTAGAVQSAESHVGAIAGALTPVNLLMDKTVAPVVTNTGATVTYIAGDDYIVKNNGIIMQAAGTNTFGANGDILVTYTSVAEASVETLADSGREYKMVFDGLNEADSGKPVLVTVHRVKINPAQALNLITDEFATLPMTFDILKDSSILGATKSKFFKIQMNQSV